MAVTPEEFKGALRRWASGVTVVTARNAAGDVGMTASSFCSLSLEPPAVLVCVRRGAAIFPALEAAGAFGVSILASEQSGLSNRFAGRVPAEQDRFADLELTRAPSSGAAWLPGASAWLDCRITAILDGGDHGIVVGEVVAATIDEDRDAGDALLYLAGRYRRAGDAI